MNKDDILQALRLTAMGRAGHPLQEQLADELALVLATPEQRAQADMALLPVVDMNDGSGVVAVADMPKKRKKAD